MFSTSILIGGVASGETRSCLVLVGLVDGRYREHISTARLTPGGGTVIREKRPDNSQVQISEGISGERNTIQITGEVKEETEVEAEGGVKVEVLIF